MVDDFIYRQPDIPYALGGCIVEDVIYDTKSIADIVKSNNENVEFVSGSLVNVGLFLVPKDSNRSNFDSFSLILNSSEWAKARIQKSINEVCIQCLNMVKDGRAVQNMFIV